MEQQLPDILARSAVHIRTTHGNQRESNLTLVPCQEGVDFTRQLIKGNPMKTVVELNFCPKPEKQVELSEKDIEDLFDAIAKELCHLECLSVVGTESTPSILQALTTFLWHCINHRDCINHRLELEQLKQLYLHNINMRET